MVILLPRWEHSDITKGSAKLNRDSSREHKAGGAGFDNPIMSDALVGPQVGIGLSSVVLSPVDEGMKMLGAPLAPFSSESVFELVAAAD
jgi:hypothetical protein